MAFFSNQDFLSSVTHTHTVSSCAANIDEFFKSKNNCRFLALFFKKIGELTGNGKTNKVYN